MSQDAGVRYRINGRDEIAFVDEAWDRFASTNDGAEIAASEVLGRSLWDFISDGATRQLYQQIVARVRRGGQAQFKLRCDSPSCRRHLEMTIRAVGADEVEFATRSLQAAERPPISLFARGTPRSSAVLRVCAWCNRVDVDTDTWAEVEVAVERLKLFEAGQVPQLTHGVCAACFATMTSVANDLNTGA